MNFKKANIVIVTLFITIVVGLIGLIVTKYIFNLIKVSSENLKYYKSYYLAYAGIETELLKIAWHGIWFEDRILSWSDTIKKNFTGSMYFESKIKSLSKYVSSNPNSLIDDSINYCADYKNWISLGTWEWFLMPLFYDKNTSEAKLTWINYELVNASLADINLNYSWALVAWFQQNNENKKLVNLAWNDSKTLFDLFGGISYSVDTKPFISIWAKSPVSFCINSNFPIVDYISYIQSKGSYFDRVVYLKVIKKHKWANFTIYWIY